MFSSISPPSPTQVNFAGRPHIKNKKVGLGYRKGQLSQDIVDRRAAFNTEVNGKYQVQQKLNQIVPSTKENDEKTVHQKLSFADSFKEKYQQALSKLILSEQRKADLEAYNSMQTEHQQQLQRVSAWQSEQTKKALAIKTEKPVQGSRINPEKLAKRQQAKKKAQEEVTSDALARQRRQEKSNAKIDFSKLNLAALLPHLNTVEPSATAPAAELLPESGNLLPQTQSNNLTDPLLDEIVRDYAPRNQTSEEIIPQKGQKPLPKHSGRPISINSFPHEIQPLYALAFKRASQKNPTLFSNVRRRNTVSLQMPTTPSSNTGDVEKKNTEGQEDLSLVDLARKFHEQATAALQRLKEHPNPNAEKIRAITNNLELISNDGQFDSDFIEHDPIFDPDGKELKHILNANLDWIKSLMP